MANKIEDIQVMRTVAILMVLAQHFSLSQTIFDHLPWKLSNPFYVGVELFFVISGYVVTRSVTQGSMNGAAFFIRRLFRLLPPMLAFLVFGVFTNMAMRFSLGNNPWGTDFFTVSLRTYLAESFHILTGSFINYVPRPAYNHGAMWSLSVEFQFYAAITVMLLLFAVVRLAQPARLKAFKTLAYAAVALAIYGRFARQTGLTLPWLYDYLISWRFDFLIMGVLLAFSPQSLWQRLQKYGWQCLGLLLLLPPVLLMFCRGGMTGAPNGPDIRDGGVFFVVSLCYAGAVGLASANVLQRAHATMAYRVLLWVGERSYALYLIHFACMALAWRLIVASHTGIEEKAWGYGIAQVVVTLLILLPAVELIYRFVELPGIAWGKKLLAGKAAKSSP